MALPAMLVAEEKMRRMREAAQREAAASAPVNLSLSGGLSSLGNAMPSAQEDVPQFDVKTPTSIWDRPTTAYGAPPPRRDPPPQGPVASLQSQVEKFGNERSLDEKFAKRQIEAERDRSDYDPTQNPNVSLGLNLALEGGKRAVDVLGGAFDTFIGAPKDAIRGRWNEATGKPEEAKRYYESAERRLQKLPQSAAWSREAIDDLIEEGGGAPFRPMKNEKPTYTPGEAPNIADALKYGKEATETHRPFLDRVGAGAMALGEGLYELLGTPAPAKAGLLGKLADPLGTAVGATARAIEVGAPRVANLVNKQLPGVLATVVKRSPEFALGTAPAVAAPRVPFRGSRWGSVGFAPGEIPPGYRRDQISGLLEPMTREELDLQSEATQFLRDNGVKRNSPSNPDAVHIPENYNPAVGARSGVLGDLAGPEAPPAASVADRFLGDLKAGEEAMPANPMSTPMRETPPPDVGRKFGSAVEGADDEDWLAKMVAQAEAPPQSTVVDSARPVSLGDLAKRHPESLSYDDIRAAVAGMEGMKPADQLAAFNSAFPGKGGIKNAKQAREAASQILTERRGSFEQVQGIRRPVSDPALPARLEESGASIADDAGRTTEVSFAREPEAGLQAAPAVGQEGSVAQPALVRAPASAGGDLAAATGNPLPPAASATPPVGPTALQYPPAAAPQKPLPGVLAKVTGRSPAPVRGGPPQEFGYQGRPVPGSGSPGGGGRGGDPHIGPEGQIEGPSQFVPRIINEPIEPELRKVGSIWNLFRRAGKKQYENTFRENKPWLFRQNIVEDMDYQGGLRSRTVANHMDSALWHSAKQVGKDNVEEMRLIDAAIADKDPRTQAVLAGNPDYILDNGLIYNRPQFIDREFKDPEFIRRTGLTLSKQEMPTQAAKDMEKFFREKYVIPTGVEAERMGARMEGSGPAFKADLTGSIVPRRISPALATWIDSDAGRRFLGAFDTMFGDLQRTQGLDVRAELIKMATTPDKPIAPEMYRLIKYLPAGFRDPPTGDIFPIQETALISRSDKTKSPIRTMRQATWDRLAFAREFDWDFEKLPGKYQGSKSIMDDLSSEGVDPMWTTSAINAMHSKAGGFSQRSWGDMPGIRHLAHGNGTVAQALRAGGDAIKRLVLSQTWLMSATQQLGEGPAASGWGKTIKGMIDSVGAEARGLNSPHYRDALKADAISKDYLLGGAKFIDSYNLPESISKGVLNRAEIGTALNGMMAGANDIGPFTVGQHDAAELLNLVKSKGLKAIPDGTKETFKNWRVPDEYMRKLDKLTPEEEEDFILGVGRAKAAYEQLRGLRPQMQPFGMREMLAKPGMFAVNYTWNTTKRTFDNVYDIMKSLQVGDVPRFGRELNRFLTRALGYELAGMVVAPMANYLTGKDRKDEDWATWMLKNLAYTGFFGFAQIGVDVFEKLRGANKGPLNLRGLGNPAVSLPADLLKGGVESIAKGEVQPLADVAYKSTGMYRPLIREGLGYVPPSERRKQKEDEAMKAWRSSRSGLRNALEMDDWRSKRSSSSGDDEMDKWRRSRQ